MMSNSRVVRCIWIANVGLAMAALVISIDIALRPLASGHLKMSVESAERRQRRGEEQTFTLTRKNLEYYRPIWQPFDHGTG